MVNVTRHSFAVGPLSLLNRRDGIEPGRGSDGNRRIAIRDTTASNADIPAKVALSPRRHAEQQRSRDLREAERAQQAQARGPAITSARPAAPITRTMSRGRRRAPCECRYRASAG